MVEAHFRQLHCTALSGKCPNRALYVRDVLFRGKVPLRDCCWQMSLGHVTFLQTQNFLLYEVSSGSYLHIPVAYVRNALVAMSIEFFKQVDVYAVSVQSPCSLRADCQLREVQCVHRRRFPRPWALSGPTRPLEDPALFLGAFCCAD